MTWRGNVPGRHWSPHHAVEVKTRRGEQHLSGPMRWRRVLAAVVTLIGGTSAILMSPVFSSRIIECLIGQRPEVTHFYFNRCNLC